MIAPRLWPGFALNVCPDLSHYDAIIPCRIRDKEVSGVHLIAPDVCCTSTPHGLTLAVCGLWWRMQVTSLSKELKREVSVEEVTPVLLDSFREVFGNEWTPTIEQQTR
jgi:lipoate-protein ligase B